MNNKIKLNNGIEMPQMIISSNHMVYEQILNVVSTGVDCGFNGFDTSPSYKTEYELGNAVNKLIDERGLTRKDFFIIDKVDKIPMLESNGDVLPYVEASLKKLKMDYVDLLLIHWPLPDYYINTWKCMEIIYAQGLAKAIGICNFNERHLVRLLNADINICPMVNQIELHPLRTVEGLIKLHNKYGIVTQAYSPLCKMIDPLYNAEILEKLTQRYKKSKAQIILRWHVQSGHIPVFKTQNPNRVRENLNIFDFLLDDDDMSSISALNSDYKFHVESICCPGF
jgi:diketogulonate reductase-like aldo/keto reductase